MAPKLYSTRLSPCARAVEMLAQSIGLQLDVVPVELNGDHRKGEMARRCALQRTTADSRRRHPHSSPSPLAMRKIRAITALEVALVVLLLVVAAARSCNEAVCGPVVSKCLLTKSCSCDLVNRTCSSVCFRCLGMLYTECCDCVEMCPKTDGVFDLLDKSSYVEDLTEPVPDLFQMLIEGPDSSEAWTSEVFLLHINVSKKGIDVKKKPEYEIAAVNCSVLFWSQCMGYGKCKQSCISIGSSSFRLFHDGCCQCVGTNCIDYGIKESRCSQCPMRDENFESLDEDENDLIYDDD